jgi:hypothetical protein
MAQKKWVLMRLIMRATLLFKLLPWICRVFIFVLFFLFHAVG